jgi:hypothetical protein
MAPGSGYHSRLDLACEPSAVRYARGHAEDTLQTWGVTGDLADDALIVVSELATNAVRHTGRNAEPFDPARGRPKVPVCALLLWLDVNGLYVAVYDESRQVPVPRPPSDDLESGRGLQLVAGLSEGAWGFDYPAGKAGKVVWARLRLPVFTEHDQCQRNARHDEFHLPARRSASPRDLRAADASAR